MNDINVSRQVSGSDQAGTFTLAFTTCETHALASGKTKISPHVYVDSMEIARDGPAFTKQIDHWIGEDKLHPRCRLFKVFLGHYSSTPCEIINLKEFPLFIFFLSFHDNGNFFFLKDDNGN